MYIKNPYEIERRSFEIIRSHIKGTFNEGELNVVMRMIHTTGDFDYENIVVFKNKPVDCGIEVFKRGVNIFTDTKMAYSGINKRRLKELSCSIDCFIDDEEVFRRAKEKDITRSMASIDKAVDLGFDVYVIGNAPTALFRLIEHIKNGNVSPKLVIGVPVGFVGAKESKEELRKLDVPQITTVGTKGGSNVAASIVNSILYMVG
ncbi:MAG: precorrin-8X methylmutase [Caloramator sp.]|uniref:Precorrin-8X methylmutase n=1 Tax=Caloramator proteoclasticus DSM 10124 TaxID=1121262 RepID=A0A1M4S8X1_9CLOT|nr:MULTISPECIES: precorrin-8X methylmutase [Caloramator]GIW48639.1 MAG: precorrin-8X methylmutase [Caloramator sp.]SHE28605.1 precorrin-8X methylmutase [Caloramator proteoclasticus DSM 10124]